MATQFGDKVRALRIKHNLLLRQVASMLDMDTSIISKIERGERQIKKEQIPVLADTGGWTGWKSSSMLK